MKKRGKPRFEEKAIEEKTSLHSKQTSISYAIPSLLILFYSQLMILSITKAVISCTHLMTLESTYVQMPHRTNVLSRRNRFMYGRVIIKEWLKFGGFPRLLICFCLAVWMVEQRSVFLSWVKFRIFQLVNSFFYL